MDAIYYSLAFGGSEIAPAQLTRSLESVRIFSPDIRVLVYLFGDAPPGFPDELRKLNAEVRHLGDHRAYIARTEPDRAELFALDPKIHRWLVLEEPELKACARFLYIDSDTLFFAPPTRLFDRYADADLYAREEPFSRRSALGYNPDFVNEDWIAELRDRDGLSPVPPFNTGVCLLRRAMADAITAVLPQYFDYAFRFLAWFHHNPLPFATGINSSPVTDERYLQPAAAQALPYRSKNRWIFDQVALWLALGRFTELRYADFAPSDVWQGGEFQQLAQGARLPILCHYFGSNTTLFFDMLQRLSSQGAR